jgi:Na+/melibiose symporter-like transporter
MENGSSDVAAPGLSFQQRNSPKSLDSLSAPGWLLASFGFVAKVEQTDTSLLGIRIMFTIIPACFAVMNALVLVFYNLSDTRVQEIELELKERRALTP